MEGSAQSSAFERTPKPAPFGARRSDQRSARKALAARGEGSARSAVIARSSSASESGLSFARRASHRRANALCRAGSSSATRHTRSRASKRSSAPSSRAVALAMRRFLCSTARRKIARGHCARVQPHPSQSRSPRVGDPRGTHVSDRGAGDVPTRLRSVVGIALLQLPAGSSHQPSSSLLASGATRPNQLSVGVNFDRGDDCRKPDFREEVARKPKASAIREGANFAH